VTDFIRLRQSAPDSPWELPLVSQTRDVGVVDIHVRPCMGRHPLWCGLRSLLCVAPRRHLSTPSMSLERYSRRVRREVRCLQIEALRRTHIAQWFTVVRHTLAALQGVC
jgi:hypothetical protein